MWASGQLTFHQDLRIGEAVTKTSEILKVAEKEGKAGRMVFVTVRHTIGSARGVAIEEQQDIVYLPMPKQFVPAAPNPVPEDLRMARGISCRSGAVVPFLRANLQRAQNSLRHQLR